MVVGGGYRLRFDALLIAARRFQRIFHWKMLPLLPYGHTSPPIRYPWRSITRNIACVACQSSIFYYPLLALYFAWNTFAEAARRWYFELWWHEWPDGWLTLFLTIVITYRKGGEIPLLASRLSGFINTKQKCSYRHYHRLLRRSRRVNQEELFPFLFIIQNKSRI